ncbi:nicotinate-nucleotide--dimethylbenzimidazole phosphoribosyltransferase [Nocardiopsis alba]|uniref:nicotinate-nucleotide--dimethylbenzimidazole phosphoribosyltransferase n=1 Tax=Nocardiopsis alba TaxID=53437 RepID=UPI0033B6DCC4
MTDHDREDARHREYEGPKWMGGRTAPGLGPALGGLFEGLPGTGQGPRGRDAMGDPSHRVLQEPQGAPMNPVRPERHTMYEESRPEQHVSRHPEHDHGETAGHPSGTTTPRTEPASRPSMEGRRVPAAEERAEELRPNVIPFRGGAQPPRSTPPRPQWDTGASTDHGQVDEPPMSVRPTVRDGVERAHETLDPLPEPPHQGSPRSDEAVEADRPRPSPETPRSPSDDVPRASERDFDETERAAVYRVIRERRDVHAGFRPDPVPADVLTRVLEAAHQAPGVGHTQPWDFLVIDDPELRARVRDLAERERATYDDAHPDTRAHALSGLKVEAIAQSPTNIAVTVDPTRGGRTPGRHSKPASYSAALAVENLWLAARTEGLGVGWVSLVDEREVADALDLPSHLEVVAYLCVGYVEESPTTDTEDDGRTRGRPLAWVVHRDRYGRRGLPGQEPTTLLEETITAIGALDHRAVEEARDRQARMTKPPGSLGGLEEVSIRLAGLAGQSPPPIPEPAAVAVFAGDHGVHAQGVTPWPQEVTAQMVRNFLDGGAVVNAFAAQVGAEVTVVDVGVIEDLAPRPGLLSRKVARGTADLARGPAMSREQALHALETGIEVARDLVSSGARCLLTGDMGIANTTPSAALICAFTGADPALVTGRGTGVDDATYGRKVEVVRQALTVDPPDLDDPIGVLASLGGLEHAALTGFILGGAALRVPVLLDGVIAGSAAAAAAAISPESMAACFAGHRSTEPGHDAVLEHLGLRPLIDLEMRLGEGSGALLALPLLQAAARALRDVATFDTAGVSTAP